MASLPAVAGAAGAEAARVAGVCNCCLAEGEARSLLQHDVDEANYVQAVLLCYGLDMMATEIGDLKRVICDACVRRLHEAATFRRLIEATLRVLERAAREADDKPLASLKLEGDSPDERDYDGYADDSNLLVEMKVERAELALVAAEQEKKRFPRRRHKLTLQALALKGNRQNFKDTRMPPTSEDITTFLDAGLIPFKTCAKKTYQCTVCNERFKQLTDLQPHFAQHKHLVKFDAVKKFARNNTKTQFEYASSKMKCKRCSELIDSVQALQEHLSCKNAVRGIKGAWRATLPFKLEKDQVDCPVCQKRFLNFVNLNTHMNLHYPNYICESCGKAFASKPRLRGHMRIHEYGEFKCKYCDAVFDRATKRENHVSKEHKAGVRYSCPRCGMSLMSFYARQKHLADSHNEELKRYKCKLCPQSYITPGHLSSHVRRDHLNERNHKCDKCHLAFYTRNSLKMHMVKHDGERIYSCQVCTKSYQRAKTLKEHMRIHNNDKRFMCPVCGRAFTQKCTLKSHLKVHDRKPETGGAEDSKDAYGTQFHSV